MHLLEAILEANHRAAAGDKAASVALDQYADALPLVALTCIDVRLNRLLPEALGVPEEQFIWLRNAGNLITSPLSSTVRSLALACAVKGGREIVILGHTDCQIAKTTTMQLIDCFKQVGVERHLLPDNLAEFFGTFASERQNVIRSTGIVRSSPLIGPKAPVHGLVIDIQTGRLEMVVNGYEQWASVAGKFSQVVKSAEGTVDSLRELANFQIGGRSFSETKIGEAVTGATDWAHQQLEKMEIKSEVPPVVPPAPPVWFTSDVDPSKAIPLPPRIPPSLRQKFKLRNLGNKH